LVVEIGLLGVWEVAKALKGRSAHFLLREFTWLKKKYFWGSGVWSPAVYFDGVGNRTADQMRAYVREQGRQAKLNDWVNTAGL
jgi:REP element-mobilizing transposase RayT